MKYAAVTALGLLGVIEFAVRAVFVLLMTCTIIGLVCILDDLDFFLQPVTFKLAQEINNS